MSSPQSVSVDQVRQILCEVIDALESPEYSSKLYEAKEAAGNEMLKMMQIVFPMVVQVEMEVIKRHGFSQSREGIVLFKQLVREMEAVDGEVARLHNQIRSHYLPPVSITSTVDTSLLLKCNMRPRKYRYFVCVCVLFYIYYFFGVGDYMFSRSYEDEFNYPLNVNVRQVAENIMAGKKPDIKPINRYPYRFLTNSGKCRMLEKLDLLIIVKSAMDHFEFRDAIRQTYGQENFVPGTIIKTLFFLGIEGQQKSELQKKIDNEMAQHKDIIQIDFIDNYYNNTIKTMMSFRWAFENCAIADHYLFTDDDMYISINNLLEFVTDYSTSALKSSMTIYEENVKPKNINMNSAPVLFAGYVFKSTPHRLKSSKWRVSLDEYPWNRWPPYVTAGAYVVSNRALKLFYIGSLYVKHFRFDDIYLGILAKKLDIKPVHNSQFHFYKKEYSKDGYRDVIASHGYHNHDELVHVWNELNSVV